MVTHRHRRVDRKEAGGKWTVALIPAARSSTCAAHLFRSDRLAADAGTDGTIRRDFRPRSDRPRHANLIDQLLDSPHYGERWGRHWLDVARYADSDGQESDRDRPHAYPYRDFVIQAFNDDMPYDQFVRWQIAGDEFEPDNDEAVSATGFLTAGPAFKLEDTFLEEERLFNRYNELDDVISTLGQSLLGLTVGCARCHDHKYDAFSAREYYQLLGVFHSGDRVNGKLPSGKEGFFFQDFDSKVRTTWLFRRSDFYDREIQKSHWVSPRCCPTVATRSNIGPKPRQSHGERKQYPCSVALWPIGSRTRTGRRSVAGSSHRQPCLATSLRPGPRAHESDFGVRGDPPSHPVVARIPGQRLRRERLENQIVCTGRFSPAPFGSRPA